MSRVSRPRRPPARKPFAPSFAASGLAKPGSEVAEAGEQGTEPSTASEVIAPVESKASEAQVSSLIPPEATRVLRGRAALQ